jgi:hypothetical protein
VTIDAGIESCFTGIDISSSGQLCGAGVITIIAISEPTKHESEARLGYWFQVCPGTIMHASMGGVFDRAQSG